MVHRLQPVLVLALLGCLNGWSQDASSPKAAIEEASRLAASGNLSRAEEILTGLEKTFPQYPEIQYRLGLVLLRQQKTAAAGERLERAVLLAPGSPLVWLGAAQTRLQLGQRAEAIQAADKALALAPQEPAVARALAMFYTQAGEFAKAAEQELRSAEAEPQQQQSLARAADLYLRGGDAGKAVELGEQAASKGDNAEIRRLLGHAYRQKGDAAGAVEQFQQAIRLDPTAPASYIDLAQLLIDHRTPQPAAVLLEEGTRRVPQEPELVRLLGLAYYGMGDAGKALDTFLKLTDMQPDSQVAYASLETLLPEAGERLPEIVERLRGFCERNPANPVGYFLRARVLQIQSPDALKEMRALLEKAVSEAPEFWPAHFELHKLLLEAGAVGTAAQALEKTIALNPEYAPAHYSLAQVYARLGNRDAARKARERHHELLEQQRDTAELRRAQAPTLSYTIGER